MNTVLVIIWLVLEPFQIQQERLSYEVESQNKNWFWPMIRFKNKNVTKVKVEISEMIEEAGEAEK